MSDMARVILSILCMSKSKMAAARLTERDRQSNVRWISFLSDCLPVQTGLKKAAMPIQYLR